MYSEAQVNWPTVDEDDPKFPFSIATTPIRRGRCPSFPWFAPLTFDPYFIMLSVKQGRIKYHFFEYLVRLDLGFNSGLLGLWRTLGVVAMEKGAFRVALD